MAALASVKVAVGRPVYVRLEAIKLAMQEELGRQVTYPEVVEMLVREHEARPPKAGQQ